ncbi:TAXI family TRAP transporter solute-binding subunit [Hydrogenophilus thiooxidans]|uniref:TAXI family TRAP transporter solute-binding subunit n=1 Tax=Hydrogenophilus thiooxidans TaxID=2820326 RepID=UPI001C24D5EC|nr:TAXI family TRAP transporter solute-binding subunit [Hydrogenophilus thiooxidans]
MKRREFLQSSLATLLLPVAWHAQAQGQTFVTILTGGTSGVYYPLGVALSQVVGQVLPNAKVNVQATKASAENLNLLAKGRGEVAFTLGDTFAYAWSGDAEAGFPTPLKQLRTLAAIYPNYIQIVASKDSGIRSLTDLKGKRVAVGAPRSGTEINARTIFQAAGFSYAELGKVEYVSFGESVELMKNRQLDATLISAGLGVAAVRDLGAALPIVLVPVPEAVVAKIGNPVFQPETIPAGTYEGQSEPVSTVAIRNYLATHDGVAEDLVYAITKALFEHLEALVAAHSAAKGVQLERAAENPPAPLHPGAARYYRERGVLR